MSFHHYVLILWLSLVLTAAFWGSGGCSWTQTPLQPWYVLSGGVCDMMVIILKSFPLQYLNSIQGWQRQGCVCVWPEITIVTGAWTCNGVSARHHSKLFKCTDALHSQNNPTRYKYYSDFTDEETWGPEMSINLSEVMQLINGRARIQTQAAWLICL